MKRLKHRSFGITLLLLTSIFIIACASEPVRVDLPDNHPANPQSQATVFIPPPNPFQNDLPIVEHETQGSSPMIHEKHQPADPHQMGSQMGHEATPSQTSEEQNPEHQHEEHNQ